MGMALSVIVMAAMKEPAITGVKSAVMVQLFPAARLVGAVVGLVKAVGVDSGRVIVEISAVLAVIGECRGLRRTGCTRCNVTEH